MRIEIDFKKKLEQNAEQFFSLSKKAKKKLSGLKEATIHMEKEIEKEKQKRALQEKPAIARKRKREWFEKFRWFFTSENLLMIGGRDAKTNDWIVKKFLEENDLYFHAEILGAPHCVLKTKKNEAPESSKREAAAFAVIFSRAWQNKTLLADSYWVLPSQVSKKAPTGEAIGKGAFMIYGERHFEKKIALECGIGLEKTAEGLRVISGPWSAVQKHAFFCVKLIPGEMEKGELSKKLFLLFKEKAKGELGSVSLDEIIQLLPTGGSKIVPAN